MTSIGAPLARFYSWLVEVGSLPASKIVLLTIMFGGFGGLVAHFINNEKQPIFAKIDFGKSSSEPSGSGDNPTDGSKAEGANAEPLKWYAYPSKWESALIGVAGSLAFLFFLIGVSGISDTFGHLEQLRVVAVSVIAGLGARSLLPRMVGQLENQVLAKAKEASNQAVAAKNQTEKIAAATRVASDDHLLIAEAQKAAFGDGKDEDRTLLIKKLEARRQEDAPLEANGYIVLARLYRVQHDIPKAIDVLTSYLTAAGKVTPPDQAYSTVLYNRACYRCLQASTSAVPDQNLLEQALDDLREALRYSEDPGADRKYAAADDDLTALRNDTRFKEFTSQAGEPATPKASQAAAEPPRKDPPDRETSG
jgi:hypothetical protein